MIEYISAFHYSLCRKKIKIKVYCKTLKAPLKRAEPFSYWNKKEQQEYFLLLNEVKKWEFSAGCQPRYPLEIPMWTWKSLSPSCGLQLILLQGETLFESINSYGSLPCSIYSTTFCGALNTGTSQYLCIL